MTTPSIGFVSTYPPTHCGLATFTASLRQAYDGTGEVRTSVVRLVERPGTHAPHDVAAELVEGDRDSLRRAAAHLAEVDVVVLQHEFGIYGGRDGDEVLALLDLVLVPVVVVLHTVLTAPTRHQHEVLQAVLDRADAVVTLTEAARDRLLAGHRVDPARVHLIPHGATAPRPVPEQVTAPSRFTALTWGLLGPGKGIEWAVEAMALVRDVVPTPHYVVAGQTHPKVLQHDGDVYRQGLLRRVRDLGLERHVTFDNRYHDAASLGRIVAAADVVLLPYDSLEQVTSGVLTEALAAGKPVIATGFPHAREALRDGAGLLVPHRDAPALALALRTVATRYDVASSMAAAARRSAPGLQWPVVADQYRALVDRLVTARTPV